MESHWEGEVLGHLKFCHNCVPFPDLPCVQHHQMAPVIRHCILPTKQQYQGQLACFSFSMSVLEWMCLLSYLDKQNIAVILATAGRDEDRLTNELAPGD